MIDYLAFFFLLGLLGAFGYRVAEMFIKAYSK